MHTIRVWDLPTRLFHWALVLCVVGLIVTGNIGGNTMVWHGRLGYAVLTLLLFRLAWGLLGGHWSRFSSFLYAPSSVLTYLRGQGQPEHSVGHNPLGALSVFAFLLILLAQVGSGLFADDEIAFSGPLAGLVSGDWVSEATSYHKNVGKFILIALVALHLGAIAFYKLFRKQALVAPMIVGDKTVPSPVPASQDNARTRLLALVVLVLCALAVYAIVSLGGGMVPATSFA
ncbi:MAG: cytochrome b [Comamonadaceae bacterium]|nr:cytochrome b [Comamonadaceae bacterium]